MSFTLLSTPSELFIRRGDSSDWFAFHVDGNENRVRFGRKGDYFYRFIIVYSGQFYALVMFGIFSTLY